MSYGICDLSCIPMRKEPSHRSEQVSELLFGDSFEVLDEHKEWSHIQCSFDGYQGWVLTAQTTWYSGIEYKNDRKKFHPCSYDILQPAISQKRQVPILIGSSLPHFDGMVMKLNKESFAISGRVTSTRHEKETAFLLKTAYQYLNAPYRWGGKSPFGIDCSGFTQMVYKMQNVRLLRDASMQATQGESIYFLSQCLPGDLAFFGDDDKITHVGMLIDQETIIHASGRVRIDKVDQQGIFNAERKQYTHTMRLIKRITHFNP